MSENNHNEQATGITFSEQVSDETLAKLEDFDTIDEGDFLDWVNEPGRFLATLLSVRTKDNGEKASENMLFKVVGGTPATQVGKVFMERIYHTAVDRSLKIAKRMGVWAAEQHQAFLEAVKNGDCAAGPDFSPCVGKQFVVVMKAEKYNEKESIKMDYVGIWQANDSRVADFVASLKGGSTAAAKPATNGATNGNGKAAPTQSQPAKEPAKPATTGKATSRTTSAGGGARATRQPAAAAAGDLNEL